MAWRIVKQPNGAYARYSDVIDGFDILNMNQDQALAFCVCEMGRQAGTDKVKRADQNPDRWAKDLDTARAISKGDDLREARIEIARAIGSTASGPPIALILNTAGHAQWRTVSDEWIAGS